MNLPAGKTKRIHVNGALLRSRANAKKPIAVRCGRKVGRASDVYIYGPSRMVYRDKTQPPLRGTTARVWVETEAPVEYR